MEKIVDFTKELFLDVFSAIRGFAYGFLVMAVIIAIIGAAIYLVLWLRNLIW